MSNSFDIARALFRINQIRRRIYNFCYQQIKTKGQVTELVGRNYNNICCINCRSVHLKRFLFLYCQFIDFNSFFYDQNQWSLSLFSIYIRFGIDVDQPSIYKNRKTKSLVAMMLKWKHI